MHKQAVFFSAQIKQFISYFVLLCEDGLLPWQHVVLISS